MSKAGRPSITSQSPQSEGVESALERKILSGELEEGQKLPSEGKLCDEFGVSRTALREALRELRGRGLIETINGSGSYVASGNLEMVSKAVAAYSSLVSDEKASNDLIEFRILIEGAALNRLAHSKRNKATRIERLNELIGKMRITSNDLEFGELDSQFHIQILESCNNAFISMIGKALYSHYQKHIGLAHMAATEGMRVDTIEEHEAIITALINSDGKAAQTALENHLTAAAERSEIMGLD
ncbi:FadR/GntR family transcriptional regulator [Rubritalea marina]|uniref:FadR/GntR family transcriptional regulator n=1 Tax=Rubritalea marina TaxID=361055 RepID=UPI000367CBBC|nr:FadR/GntR family transcriptional regulator [Rubritalea marina]